MEEIRSRGLISRARPEESLNKRLAVEACAKRERSLVSTSPLSLETEAGEAESQIDIKFSGPPAARPGAGPELTGCSFLSSLLIKRLPIPEQEVIGPESGRPADRRGRPARPRAAVAGPPGR